MPDQTGGSAAFSPCGNYRWWLERHWAEERQRLICIGLNPSRADGRRDDATLRRLMGFARCWGYGALEVLNLFGRISPTPALLRRAADPVGADNDAWIRSRLLAHPAATLWLAWGNAGAWGGRDRQLGRLLAIDRERPCVCAGRTRLGQPRHPLYLPAAVVVEPWQWPKPELLGHPGGDLTHPSAPLPCRAHPVATRFTCT